MIRGMPRSASRILIQFECDFRRGPSESNALDLMTRSRAWSALFAGTDRCRADSDSLNAWLEEQCLKRQGDVLRGHVDNIEVRLIRDLDILMELPPVPFDACEKVSTKASAATQTSFGGMGVPRRFNSRRISAYVSAVAEVIVAIYDAANICCCAGSRNARPGWIWITIHTCPRRMWRRQSLGPITGEPLLVAAAMARLADAEIVLTENYTGNHQPVGFEGPLHYRRRAGA